MPQRRCAGCGRVTGKSELIRLAVSGQTQPGERRIVLDRRGVMSGRGVYLCVDADGARPNSACLTVARSRRALQRTLRASVPLGCELVESVDR